MVRFLWALAFAGLISLISLVVWVGVFASHRSIQEPIDSIGLVATGASMRDPLAPVTTVVCDTEEECIAAVRQGDSSVLEAVPEKWQASAWLAYLEHFLWCPPYRLRRILLYEVFPTAGDRVGELASVFLYACPEGYIEIPEEFLTRELAYEFMELEAGKGKNGLNHRITLCDLSHFQGFDDGMISAYFVMGGRRLECLPEEFLTDERITWAVTQDWREFRHVPEEHRNRKYYRMVVELSDGAALNLVPWPLRLENDCELSWFALEKSNAGREAVPEICFARACNPDVGRVQEE